LLALVFGFFAFRSRIKGVYFSIMTQALTFAGMLLFFRNETGFGGNNGFTNFRTILGFGITEPGTRAVLFLATVLLLVASLFIGWRLAQSKFGRVLTALRDAENRLMFCGYDPRGFKLFVWVLSAVLCGLAGALYVPQVGIINPSEMSPTNSIEAAVWVALGGRGTLDRSVARCRCGQWHEELVHRGVPGILAVLPRRAVHRRDAVPAQRRDRSAEETR
jgi:urea transport system permease protein